jgi:hypothetical protein
MIGSTGYRFQSNDGSFLGSMNFILETIFPSPLEKGVEDGEFPCESLSEAMEPPSKLSIIHEV